METIRRSPSTRLFSDNCREGGFSSNGDVLGRPQIRIFSSPRHFSNSIALHHKRRVHRIFETSPSSSETQIHLRSQETQDASKNVHVKFQLQKDCLFGEQFYLVGDDPLLGSWDPSSAIQLDWSDGHLWTVELDMRIGKSIQFKFLLKGANENILWQPGPDRILQTWETENTISVSEDWDNPELQMLMEEEPTSNQNAKSIADVNGESAFTDTILKRLPEKSASIVAENISDSMHSNSAQFDAGSSADYAEGHICASNLVSYQGDLVLVPGLTSLTAVETEETSPSEVNDKIAANASLEVHEEAKELNVHKLGLNIDPDMNSLDPKNSTEMMSKDGEELHGTEQVDKQQIVKEVFENDVQWGRRTLQKLLSGFGILLHQIDR